MPPNHTHLTRLSAHLAHLTIDAIQTADQLLAQPMNDAEAELHLTPAASLLTMLLDQLQDALYRAEKLDQSHRQRDLIIAQTIARHVDLVAHAA
jgi:hypothetical protein